MKIRFKGVMETQKKGCPVCGRKRKNTKVFAYSKKYILPSGITKTFRIGRVEEVNERDAEFLLSYQYEDANGNLKKVFELC